MAQESQTQLVVCAKDGTKVAYILSDEPKITFTESDLVITVNGVEVNYSLEKMARFTYESSDNTVITNLETDEALFKLEGELLLFLALESNSTIAIYTLNGALVMKKTIQQSGEYAFPLSSLDAGVYVVNVNDLTYKIVKR